MLGDSKDDFLLSLAVDGEATHILTGDKDLIVLHPFADIQIVTIADDMSGIWYNAKLPDFLAPASSLNKENTE